MVLPTVLGVIALGGAIGIACDSASVPPDPAPDGILPIPSSDGPTADSSPPDAPDASVDAPELDAFVPLDSPADTPA